MEVEVIFLDKEWLLPKLQKSPMRFGKRGTIDEYFKIEKYIGKEKEFLDSFKQEKIWI